MATGVLRIYLGVAPGAGATVAMLEEGQRRARRGTEVLVAGPVGGGRSGTERRCEGLEVLRGTSGSFDVESVISRRPGVVLVDDLHGRDPMAAGSGRRRWDDIDDVLAAGIDVVTTLSAHRLESFRALQIAVTGSPDGDEVPDAVVHRADQVELVDISPEALRRRLAHGNVLPAEEVDAAVAAFYRADHLAALRERTLRWMADDLRRRRSADDGTRPMSERVVVGLTGAPSGQHVVEQAVRLAGQLGADLVGVHVRPNDGLTSRSGPMLEAQRRLVAEVNGTYHELVGDDIAEALAAFALADHARHLVLGTPHVGRSRLGPSVVERAIELGPGLDIHVIADPVAASRHPGVRLPRVRRPVSPVPFRRRVGAWMLCLAGLPLLTVLLTHLRGHVSLSTDLLLSLSLVLAVAGIGGLIPGLVASVLGFSLTNWFFVPPFHTLHIADVQNVVTLVVFVAVAVVVSALADRSARRSREARRARAEAAALASTSAVLVGSSAPLPDLLAQLRATFGLRSAAVLDRTPTGWSTNCAVGEHPPSRPDQGLARPLDREGRVQLVLDGDALAVDDQMVLTAFIDQLATALEASRLRSEAERLETLGRTNSLRSALLQAVSHDLRTPLASIKASASGLLRSDVEFSVHDRESLLTNIDRSADRLDRVVGNLLDMSRIQAGRLDLTRRPAALEEIVASALTSLTATGPVAIDVPESLPMVEVDAELLERSVANIISNALAWSPAGATVRVEAAEIAGRVDLRIVDQGPGIPVAARAAVFEPFQRFGDRSNDAGVGLGLAIARGFTVAMGGTLTLDDTPGGGLTVTFGLPIAEVAPR